MSKTIKKEKAKVGRRLSARVGDLFKGKVKTEVSPPAKVAENPPTIEEPTPVAPLEDPASGSAAPAAPHVEQPTNPIETTPAPAVVAAAA